MVLDGAIAAFGRKARDFALKGVDGKSYTLADVRGPKGTSSLSFAITVRM